MLKYKKLISFNIDINSFELRYAVLIIILFTKVCQNNKLGKGIIGNSVLNECLLINVLRLVWIKYTHS